MRSYSDLISKINRIKSDNDKISFLEDAISQVLCNEKLIDYDVWMDDAQKILFDLQVDINIKENPKYK